MGTEAPEVIERHVARYMRTIELVCTIEPAGRTGGVWWDVGCGTGYGSALLPGEVYAFDRHDGSREGWKCGAPQGRIPTFIHTDITQAGWSTEAPDPDVVVMIETLEHLDRYDQDGLIASIAARLKPDGVLAVACPIGNGPNPANPWHLHEPTEPELRTLLSRHFRDVSVEVEEYESTSGPAVQAWAVAKEPL